MMPSMFLALFLPCAGMSVVFIIYMCLLCYAARHLHEIIPVKPTSGNGLSAAELDKLPKTTGHELGLATECSICLDDIESEQPARVVPGCNHGFHLQCADTWFAKNPVCPVCRNKLDPNLFQSAETETNPC
ncbi:putative transcription factor C2H2 family [Helianthus annuus]|uniref:Putative RING/U-box superfamily protein n=1 Tax=Helianthus annuus TaxID=4232 RepID=A0A251SEB9_HELAN|nr:putative transcription factor C2H2 family [Helianthus annuus]KAJ0462878.1 putative transcription factor C2H2 family [Helianthus annuus]KAJ0484228.1 putative transcription factor C2H2 family [Helianthus annuus]KAJ0654783.1 putative transcription factor C2H2 family [Helianthus annuus]KAJ0658528.1 putative transcription factor C2H2 family [Helianthus annuus]